MAKSFLLVLSPLGDLGPPECYASRGSQVSVEDIILTTSTSEAYSFIFRALCYPADEILVPEPSDPLFSFLADIRNVKLTRFPLIYDL